ncbi:MAG: hypothetical protein WB439_08125 [Acidobacteriaceae bacterium]
MSRQRRKVVVMAAGVAVLAAMDGLVPPSHGSTRWEWLRWAWLGLVVVVLVKVIVEMVKLKRVEG